LVLTPNSVSSKWVDIEWRAALSREVDENKKIIIPIYLETCNVPLLLKERLHVDFRERYSIGLVKLVQTIDNPGVEMNNEFMGELAKEKNESEELSEILAELQDKEISLSKSVIKALSFARKYEHENVAEFCENELKGWDKIPENPPKHREIEAFLSVVRINNQFIGWDNNSSNMFLYMENTPERFKKINHFERNPISILEKKEKTPYDLKTGFLTWKEYIDHPKTGKTTVYFYARPNALQNVVEAIRVELTKILIDL
jgi:hypothetical protein